MSNTEKYLADMKSKLSKLLPLEENNRMLHLNGCLGNGYEYMILTYGHNVLGDMMASENKHLMKKIEEMENKLRKINTPQGMYQGCLNPPSCLPCPRTMQTRSVESEEGAGEKLDETFGKQM
ncbi:hypothetical protein EUGRSUZ_C03162 [Eucalyptus grandis]|uniref:Uncharacterized protein n=2 Tax=Eucalyptus grandis TaxID=71139 RepID=A0A059CUE2_EUCGR|nr:hypothetical protein EUGRSUZ_C03162 [Eucalyptus grandis]